MYSAYSPSLRYKILPTYTVSFYHGHTFERIIFSKKQTTLNNQTEKPKFSIVHPTWLLHSIFTWHTYFLTLWEDYYLTSISSKGGNATVTLHSSILSAVKLVQRNSLVFQGWNTVSLQHRLRVLLCCVRLSQLEKEYPAPSWISDLLNLRQQLRLLARALLPSYSICIKAAEYYEPMYLKTTYILKHTNLNYCIKKN